MVEEFHLTSVSDEAGQVDVFTGYKLVEERNIMLEAPSITDTDIDIAPELFSSEHSESVSEEEVIQLTLSWSWMKFCPVCGEKLAGMSDVRSHLESCVGEGHYKTIKKKPNLKDTRKQNCEICSKQFASKKAFIKHRFFCDPTQQLHDHAISEQQHGNTEFFEEENSKTTSRASKKSSHTCTVCSKTFACLSYLKQHMRVHTGEKPYQCTTCSKRFADKSALRNHNKLHTDERPHVCDICTKSFRRSDSLKYHKASHDPGNRPFICSHCAKSFKNQRDLRSHEKTVHSSQSGNWKEMFVCPDCNTVCDSQAILKYHKKIVHGVGKLYECEFCNKKCMTNSQLKIHIRSHTGEKPFKCSLCEKSFRRMSHLAIHEQRHTGDTVFKCSQCDRGFPQRVELKQHEKIHSAVKPFECGLCGKCFAREDYVKIHMKTHDTSAVPGVLRNLDSKVAMLPAKKETDGGETKHVYVMEPDVPGGSGGLHRVAHHEAVAATIVIPAHGSGEIDISRGVYLY